MNDNWTEDLPVMKIDNVQIQDAKGVGHILRKCIIHPLGGDTFQLVVNCKTGDMRHFGVGIDFFDRHKGRFTGGVMTKEQVFFLRDFLIDWCNEVIA